MGRALHAARLRDGLAFDGDLWAALPVLDINDEACAAERIREWFAIAAWLDQRDDPRKAWLAASALAESRRHQRAGAALARLVQRPGGAGLIPALLAAMDRDGAPPAQLAAAFYRDDPAMVDRLIPRIDADPAGLAQIIRTRLAMGPAPVERWATDPRLTLAVCRVRPEAVTSAQLRVLLDHDDMATVAEAAALAIERPRPDSLIAARHLLDRPAVFDGARRPGSPLTPPVGVAIEHLGTFGAAEDLVRIGRWRRVPRVGPDARRWLGALRARVEGLPEGGGLAVMAPVGGELSSVDDRVAEGRLSTAESAAGGLDPAIITEAREAD